MAEGDWKTWAEKAALRLAECEAEIRRLPADVRPARRAKLEARRESYVLLIARLRSRLPGSGGSDADPERAKAELSRLKDRIRSAALNLARDRDRLNALRGRHPSGNGLDFAFAPPRDDADPDEKAAFAILRSLGL